MEATAVMDWTANADHQDHQDQQGRPIRQHCDNASNNLHPKSIHCDSEHAQSSCGRTEKKSTAKPTESMSHTYWTLKR
jgi:hypothetical protein